MPRKSDKLNMKWFETQVLRVFQKTTREERAQVARAWCFDFYTPVIEAERARVVPMAVLVAALIDIDHPLLVAPRGVLYGLLECSIIILQAELRHEPVAVPFSPTELSTSSLCTDVYNPPVVHRQGVAK